MTINILSLNTTIFNKLTEEYKIKKEKRIIIDDALKEKNLFPETIENLLQLKEKMDLEQKSDKILFFTKTHEIINEYISIINSPLSRENDNFSILKRKNDLIVKFLAIIRKLIESKGWYDIEIPENPAEIKLKYSCINCNNSNVDEFEIDEFDNHKTCLNCAAQEEKTETGITYKDYIRVNVVNRFIYNRVLHFNDCIKQYQGKQNCKIPENVLNDLDKKFNAHRLLIFQKEPVKRPDPIRYSQITRSHIMMFLKDLKHTKHYENANLIYFMLTNKRVDDISYLEEKLIEDFKELIFLYDEIYGKDKKEELDRKNFLNSSYLLFQLLRRHNHQCKNENFPILKTVDRKIFHDTICNNLFLKLNWKFTPIF
jgi:hypothetical protein